MPVKQISGWQAEDGSVFSSRTEADTHQSLLDLRQFFKDALGDCDHTQEAIDTVWRHREIVRDILNRASVPERMEEKL